MFGSSKETPDFIVDCLELWWEERAFMMDDYDMLMIDLDNACPETSAGLISS